MSEPVNRNRVKSRLAWLLLLALVLCGLTLAACGGGSSDSSSEATGGEETTPAETEGEEATGEPIVTYSFADVNTEGPQYKNIEETARVYQEWINTHGGIGGRPLEANFCDARGTPTAASACAREAVAANAVAVVGSFTFTGDAIVPVLEKADTAYFGNCCSLSPAELTSPVDFQLGSLVLYGPGEVKRAVEDGCEKMNGVVIEGAEAFIPLMENAAANLGAKIGKFVSLPGTAQDYSPQVAEATAGGTDCLLMVVSETPFLAWMPAFAQSGSEAKMYGPQGNLNENVAKGFEDVTDGDIVVDVFPDISLSQWDDYREALDTYEADPSQDYNSLGGMGTWAGYEAFRQIVESMGEEEITNATFLKAAESAIIDLPGIVPPIDFALPWNEDGGPEGFDRIFNRCVTYSELNQGELVPSADQFEDLSELAGGTKPQDCGPPFS